MPDNGQRQGGHRALSRIAESRETSRPGTRVGNHWAITQQFQAQHREPRVGGQCGETNKDSVM